MNSAKSRPGPKGAARIPPLGALALAWLALCMLLFGFPARTEAQATQSPAAPAAGTAAAEPQTPATIPGTISGTILYESGTAIDGAHVKLTRENPPLSQEAISGERGQFLFTDIAPGPFQITVTGDGFEAQSASGVLHSGETYFVPEIVLRLATVVTEVRVKPPKEVAQAQIKEQEKQRVLGVIPNFYVSYVPIADVVALTPRQKFQLAWRSSVDPVTFGGIIFIAAFQQAGDSYPQWGQGWGAYGERYGAFYGNVVIGTFLGDAVMPSLLHQDPRYFYKGTGSKRSRLLHALSAPFICPGDNGKQQVNYSYLIGSFGAGALSTLYYPTDRNQSVAGLVVENSLVRIAENSISSVAQEFFIRKLTPHRHRGDPTNGNSSSSDQ